MAAVRPKPEARFVVFHSHDDYTTNLPLADFAEPDVLLAYSWQGRPLLREHGGPVVGMRGGRRTGRHHA